MDTQKYIKEKYSVPDDTVAMKLKGVLRQDLYVLFNELGFKLGAEVGVYRGANAKVILDTVPNLKLHLVDLWQQRSFLRQTHKTLKRLKSRIVTVEKASMDAVRYYEDESLDFVYIDADHTFDFVMQDIIEWSKKVRPGGIVAGHDFLSLIHI